MINPFTPATPVAKNLKILLYGESGTGKTLAALSFPGVAIIDAEGGTDLYAGRPGVPTFAVLRAKTLTELENAIEFIRQDGGRTFKTLVVDPITVFYDVLKDTEQRLIVAKKGDDADYGYKGWAKINNRMKALYARLTGLPVHVVVIARSATLYEGEGVNLRKAGDKPDVDKAISYMFDFVIRMNPDHSGVVLKSRGVTLGKNGALKQVNWSVFEPVSLAFVEGDAVDTVSEDEAVEREVQTEQQRQLIAEFEDKATVVRFFEHWRGQGLKDSEILTALGVQRASQWSGGLDAAHRRVGTWIEERMGAPA